MRKPAEMGEASRVGDPSIFAKSVVSASQDYGQRVPKYLQKRVKHPGSETLAYLSSGVTRLRRNTKDRVKEG